MTLGRCVMFYDVEDLKDEEICLKLDRTVEAKPEINWFAAYYFDI